MDLQPRPAKPRGLGDAVASIAKPIARRIDRAFGTRFQHCEECEHRRAWLNRLFRF